MKRVLGLLSIGLLVIYGSRRIHSPPPVPIHIAHAASVRPARPKLFMPPSKPVLKTEVLQSETQSSELSDLDRCLKKLGDESRTEAEFYNDAKSDLDRVVGGWFFLSDKDAPAPPNETSASGRFLQALGEAQLLEGRNLPPNREHALSLLLQVMQDDPGNSAPVVYAAVIEKQMGDLRKYNELMGRLRFTWHYNSYVKDFMNNMVAQVRDPRDYIPALSMIARVPIPNPDDLKQVLKDQTDERLAWQLTRDGRNPKNTRMDFDFMAIEYGLGVNVLLKNGEEVPTMKELFARSKIAIDDVTEQLEHAGANCALSDLWPAIDRAKSRSQ